MKTPQAICVYCSSKDEVADVYKDAAYDLGQMLAEKGITLVYGGGDKGLMGTAAHSTMDAGGCVIGFMPRHLQNIERPDLNITEFHFVDTMHERKQKMFDNADAFFVLPGGFGTLEEVFEVITWRQIGLHEKPIIFININNYWSPLKAVVDTIFSQKFALSHQQAFFHFADSVCKAFEYVAAIPEPCKSGSIEWM